MSFLIAPTDVFGGDKKGNMQRPLAWHGGEAVGVWNVPPIRRLVWYIVETGRMRKDILSIHAFVPPSSEVANLAGLNAQS